MRVTLLGFLCVTTSCVATLSDSTTRQSSDQENDTDTDTHVGGDETPDLDTGGDPGSSDFSPCPALSVEGSTMVSGFDTHLYAWRDADCAPRSAALVRNDQQDPKGRNGGYMRRYTYEVPTGTRTCESSHDFHPGFGVVVNHYADTAALSSSNTGTGSVVFAGRHHAIHRYQWRYGIDGHDVDVTVEWFFATGRNNPVYAITFDSSDVAEGTVQADTRSPYGDLNWDGAVGANVDGVGWGDRYRFTTLGSGPATLTSGWDYQTPNTVPYVSVWANGADAEMGLVQTQTQTQHAAGGFWFYSAWGTRDEDGPMPETWNWPYQLNQYEMEFTTLSKRVAWGMNYGSVGSTYNVYGDDGTADGHPYQSYSVFVVLDRHSEAPVAAQRQQIEAVQAVELSASVGQVALAGPAGVARNDNVTYAPAGWNPIYATWEVTAAATGVDLELDTHGSTLDHPVFVLRAWPGDDAPEVSLDDAAALADTDYFASYDAASDKLWVTVRGAVNGTRRLRVMP